MGGRAYAVSQLVDGGVLVGPEVIDDLPALGIQLLCDPIDGGLVDLE